MFHNLWGYATIDKLNEKIKLLEQTIHEMEKRIDTLEMANARRRREHSPPPPTPPPKTMIE